ncbi:hypothetical protein [Pseudomonas grandcourensis]|jgi:hypothetical protein|uniref:hypothetical protein n=1 Tax=Pseudomonas grandcourensis TaxID=3136736 RepID=UPI00326732CC
MNEKTSFNSLPLRKIQGSTLKLKNPSLSNARKQVLLNEFDSFVKWISTAQKKGKFIFQERLKGLFPKSVSRLKRDLVFISPSIDCEISWACSLIKQKHASIKDFVSISQELELQFWKGDFTACELSLSKIEKEFGISLWLIEVKMAVLQASKGLEAQKNFLSEIKKDSVKNVSFYAWVFSFRNEEPVTSEKYIKYVKDAVNKFEGSGQDNSILYKCLPTDIPSSQMLQDVLKYETNSSLIDLYSTFIDAGISFYTYDSTLNNITKSKIVSKFLEILPLTNDQRLINLLKPGEFESSEWVTLRELFLRGKWQESVDLIHKNEALAYSPQTISIEADCRIFLNLTQASESSISLRTSILNALIDIRINGKLAAKSIAYLFKLRLNLRRFDLSSTINRWLNEVFFPWPAITEPNKGTACKFSNKFNLDILNLTPTKEWHQYFSTQANLKLLSENQNHTTIIQDTFNWSQIDCHQTRKITILYRQRSLLAQKNFKLGIREASVLLIDNPSLATHIPLKEYVDALDKDLRKELASEISVPILLYIAAKTLSNAHSKICAYAYEDFLLSLKLKKPSDLAEHLNEHCKPSLIYYLKNICIADIIKVSRVFKSSIDLQNERLLVCRMLIQLDHDNKDSYEKEAREITRAQIIFAGVRHIEKSKISIDTSGLKRWADSNLNEDFNRLRSLLLIQAESEKFNTNSEDSKLINFISSPLKKDEFFFPDNETRYSLIELYWTLYIEFLYNSEYGLDCYLSMRIRHGVLSGQLRGALEKHKIITKRSSDGKNYLSNKHWTKELSSINFPYIEEVDALLSAFSKELDELIEHLVNEKIQISSSEKPDGWFRQIVTSKDLTVLQKIVSDEDTNFANFFEASTHVFWRGIDICLKDINNHIEIEVKRRAATAFEQLNRSILSLHPDSPPLTLTRTITEAKISYTQSLNVVKEWFSLPSPYEPPVFSFEQLVRVGLECVKRLKPNFSPNIEITGDNINITSMLTYFSDIFYVIFNNIEEYSGIRSPNVKVQCSIQGEVMDIHVTNEISTSAKAGPGIERVEEAKILIESGEYRRRVNEEELSGFSKVKNLIGEAHILKFDFDDNLSFSVNFTTSFNRAPQ